MQIPNPPQIDDFLSTRVVSLIGAIRTLASQAKFYLGFLQFWAIMAMAYYHPRATLVREISIGGVQPIGTFPRWNVFLGICLGGLMLFVHVVDVPARITYNSRQGSDRRRNPGYDATMDNNERLQRIERHLEIATTDGGVETTVVPECQDCGRPGVNDHHKGQDVISCPDCDQILFKQVSER